MAKILIVEDDKNSRYLLEKMLQADGHQIVSAENGEVALRVACQDTVDLVISDIMMPVMNGFRLCRDMKRDAALKHIPFVFYTATFLEKEDEELAMGLGASRFIVKPLKNAALLAEVNQVLDEHNRGGCRFPPCRC